MIKKNRHLLRLVFRAQWSLDLIPVVWTYYSNAGTRTNQDLKSYAVKWLFVTFNVEWVKVGILK